MYIRVDGPTDGIAVLTITRADKKNALSNPVRDEMSDSLDRLGADGDLKTLIVTGEGDVFSAGFDLTEFERMGEQDGVGMSELIDRADQALYKAKALGGNCAVFHGAPDPAEPAPA